MFKHYTPSAQELDMLQYQSFLYYQGDREDIPDQDTLIGYLVNAIINFDYFYAYSDSLTTWRAGESNYTWITKHINKVNDPVVRAHLSQCFNADKAKDVVEIFPWGKYVGQSTPYTRYVFKGASAEQAAYYTGLGLWLDELTSLVSASGVTGRVIYADNYPAATKILKEGLYWFNSDHQLNPVAVSAELYAKVEQLGKLYKTNEIKFTDLKFVKPNNVQAMLDGKAEVIMIKNFYMVFTYATKHAHY